MAGGRIDVEVAADLSEFNSQFEQGLEGAGEAASNFAGKIAGVLAFTGAAVSFGSIIDKGNEFTRTLNAMSGVSGATGEQMDAIKAKAMALGNDVELSATSANDAAAAMTELAKGGFSVDQSMEAAKGTLQLAAAAQIDAAEAATIQSQALQAFGLDASYAATASDVLANAANASSAEITDIAAGLQQSGAVANQFGLSIEETSATLGVLANAGITGSDAGTLLKSTLLSLTDTSKPAQAAMETLGLTVYDTQGNFVGMESLFGQLKDASAELTPEIYQQASATLFGSDAMRLSGVAAEQGSDGWNLMRETIGRQGAAAELAAAQNQGLPGVFEKIENTSERLQLQLYDLIDGPLTSFGNTAVGLADGALDKFDVALGNSGGVVQGFNEVISGSLTNLPMLSGTFNNVVRAGDSMREMALSIRDGLVEIAEGATTSGGALDTLQGGLSLATGVGATALAVLTPVVGVVASAAGAFGSLPGPIQAVVTGLVAFKIASMASSAFMARSTDGMGRMATAAHGLGTRIQGIGPATTSAYTGLRSIVTASGGLVNTARVGTVQMGSFGSSIQRLGTHSPAIASMQGAFVNAAAGASTFGRTAGTVAAGFAGLKTAAGGLMGALGGPAGLAVMGVVAALSIYSMNQRKAAQAAAEHEESIKSLIGTLDEQTGAITERTYQQKASELADSGAIKSARDYGIAETDLVAAHLNQADALGRTNQVIDDNIKRSLTSSELYRDSEKNYKAAGISLQDLTDALGGAPGKYDEVNGKIQDWNRNMGASGAANSSMMESLGALKGGMDTAGQGAANLGTEIGKSNVDLAAAQQRASDAAAALEKGRSPASQFSDAMQKLGGMAGSAEEKLSALSNALTIFNGGTVGLEQAQSRLAEASDATKAAFADAAGVGAIVNGAFDVSTETGRRLLDATNSQQQATLANAQAAYEAKKNVGDLAGAQADATAVVAASRQTFLDQIATMGIVGDEAQRMADKYIGIPSVISTLLTLDNQSFKLNAQESENIIAMLSGLEATPQVTAILTKLKEGKAITTQDLAELSKSTADPAVVLKIAEALANSQQVKDDLAGIRDKDVTIRVHMQEISAAVAKYGAWSPEAVQVAFGPKALGGPIEGGIPGKDSVPILAMPGEHMLTTADVDSLGGQEGVFRFRAALAQGKVGKFADGGAIGSDGLDNMINFARAKAGIGYDYGPWDCSMYMSHIAATGMGQQPRRLWTTYSILGGDLQGMQPGGSEGHFRIGVSQEHMAGTLFFKDGSRVDVENGGSNSGSTFGGNAAGYDDSQFPAQFHLPDSALSPALQMALTGGSGASYSGGVAKEPWTEKDALALESARVAVIQAKEAQDKVNANEKKTEADRQQAELKVQRAELKVRELEQKRDGTGAGKAIGPAPELQGAMTDDAISLRNAEIAVVDAQLARDKTYADSASSSIDREKADIAVFSAQNALEKAKAGDGAKTFNLKDRVKSYGTDVVGILVDAAFEQLPSALSESRWITTDWEGLMGVKPKPVAAAPSFSQAEIDAQLPATPGAPGWQTAIASVAGDDWQKRLADALNMPTVLRDGGGPVPHGTAALNLSGAEEWMLTADERLNLSRDFALMRGATNRGGDGASLDLSGLMSQVDRLVEHADRPNVTYQTRDIDAALRQDRLDRRKQSLTFSRRR
ncbi:phage tail tape measure protein [Rhodococcus qingshengii]|uniref:phage tail tape measure protein n=1 Tax=Rhodococcus qingshengii TaxID=334542 RepID=UPI00211ECE17|nr:phage tail tape measure protein [Rhodococcus qingshengii]